MTSKTTTVPTSGAGKTASAPVPGGGKPATKKGGSKKLDDVLPAKDLPPMSDHEKERITEVFKMYETDVRSAAMQPNVSFLKILMVLSFSS